MKYFKKKKYSILSKLSKYSFIFIIAISLMAPLVFVNAVDCNATPTDPACVTVTSTTPTTTTSTDVETGTTRIQTKIINPIGPNLNTLPDFIIKLIKIVLYVGVPIVALAIIYTGFLFVSAQGEEKKLIEAKKAIVSTLIGAVLLLGAFVIANAIQQTVDDIKS